MWFSKITLVLRLNMSEIRLITTHSSVLNKTSAVVTIWNLSRVIRFDIPQLSSEIINLSFKFLNLTKRSMLIKFENAIETLVLLKS
jgi:hypothetical protein